MNYLLIYYLNLAFPSFIFYKTIPIALIEKAKTPQATNIVILAHINSKLFLGVISPYPTVTIVIVAQ